MTTYNKILSVITIVFWIIIGIVLVLELNFYNWALWIVPLFFYFLTFAIIKFLASNVNDKYLPVKFSQASLFKLIVSLGFILLFKLFLDKEDWVNFIIFSGINYVVYTAYEVNYLLRLLRNG